MQGCEVLKIVTGLIIVLLIIIVAGHVLGIMRSVADGNSISDNLGGLLRSGLLLGVSYAFYVMYQNCSDRQAILKYFNLDDVPVTTVKKFAREKSEGRHLEGVQERVSEVREAAKVSSAPAEGMGEEEMFEREGNTDNIMD
jgi:hypothetical protein